MQELVLCQDKQEKAWLYLELGALIESAFPIPGVAWTQQQRGCRCEELPSVRIDGDGEALTAEECYCRAVSLTPHSGQAHKLLADAIAAGRGAIAAANSFRTAASLMPADICCAIHALSR